jgi:hypothetical protein
MFSKASIASDTQDQINRWKAVCMDAVQQKLKDPESARFRNVQFFRGIKNMPLCSGEVNSKNSFGGYGGYQRFISAGNLNTTFLEEQVQDFDGTLRTLKGK